MKFFILMILGIGIGGYFFDKSVSNAFGETNEGVMDLRNYVKDAEGNNNYVQTKHFSEALAPGISEGEDQYDALGPGYMPKSHFIT